MEFHVENVGTIDYASGQKKSINIPRIGPAACYTLRVQYTITNGASAAVGPFFQTLARILSRVDVKLGGRDTVVSATGAMLAARAHYEHGAPMDGMDDTVVLTGSAATVYDVSIPIPRFLPRATSPLLTADDLRRVSQATLEITWGASDCSDIYTTPNSAAISAVTCWLECEYLVGVPADMTFQVRELREISQDIPATNTDQKVIIDAGTGLNMRSVALAILDDSVGSASILNNLLIKSGNKVFHDQKAPALFANNRRTYALENPITGLYYKGFTFLGDAGFAIPTGPANLPDDLAAHLDVTKAAGTNTAIFSIEAIRPPRV